MLRQRFGESFLTRLKDQGAMVASNAVGAQQVAAGAIAMFAPGTSNFAAPLKAQGAPIDFALPEPVVSIGAYAAYSQRAPNPNAARLIMNFCMTREGQTLFNKDATSPLGELPGTFPMPQQIVDTPLPILQEAQASILAALGVR
jgi:iron(III) transport system substrate-binding protein